MYSYFFHPSCQVFFHERIRPGSNMQPGFLFVELSESFVYTVKRERAGRSYRFVHALEMRNASIQFVQFLERFLLRLKKDDVNIFSMFGNKRTQRITQDSVTRTNLDNVNIFRMLSAWSKSMCSGLTFGVNEAAVQPFFLRYDFIARLSIFTMNNIFTRLDVLLLSRLSCTRRWSSEGKLYQISE